MSGDVLRVAAALMRERALAATPGPWDEVREGELCGCTAVVAGGDDEFLVAPAVIPVNGEHVASWHPAVALAVADWLDFIAPFARFGDDDSLHAKHALVVARAYLGSAANA